MGNPSDNKKGNDSVQKNVLLQFLGKQFKTYKLDTDIQKYIESFLDGDGIDLADEYLPTRLSRVCELASLYRANRQLKNILNIVFFDDYEYSYFIATSSKVQNRRDLYDLITLASDASCEENACYVFYAISYTDILQNSDAFLYLELLSKASFDDKRTNAEYVYYFISNKAYLNHEYAYQIAECISASSGSLQAEAAYTFVCENIMRMSFCAMRVLGYISRAKNSVQLEAITALYSLHKGENEGLLLETIKSVASEEESEYLTQMMDVIRTAESLYSKSLKIKELVGQKRTRRPNDN